MSHGSAQLTRTCMSVPSEEIRFPGVGQKNVRRHALWSPLFFFHASLVELSREKIDAMRLLDLDHDVLLVFLLKLDERVSRACRILRLLRDTAISTGFADKGAFFEKLVRLNDCAILRAPGSFPVPCDGRFGDFVVLFEHCIIRAWGVTKLLVLTDSLSLDGKQCAFSKKPTQLQSVNFMGKRYFDLLRIYREGDAFVKIGNALLQSSKAIDRIIRIVDARERVSCFVSINMEVKNMVPRVFGLVL